MVAYVAEELGELYGVALNVPVAKAVFVCEPDTLGTGPTTQVTMWFSLAGTGGGRVVAAKPALHVETSSVLSVMLIGLSGTSPVFSTVNW